MLMNGCTIFMQNGAPDIVQKDVFRANKITSLKRSGNNPDLNPIENFWMVLKDKAAEKHPQIFLPKSK